MPEGVLVELGSKWLHEEVRFHLWVAQGQRQGRGVGKRVAVAVYGDVCDLMSKVMEDIGRCDGILLDQGKQDDIDLHGHHREHAVPQNGNSPYGRNRDQFHVFLQCDPGGPYRKNVHGGENGA